MFSKENIQITHGITLISLREMPSDVCLLADIFESIAQHEINIDMISQTPPRGNTLDVSFTVSDEEMAKVLTLTNQLSKEFAGIGTVVSSNNVKLTVSESSMNTRPGMANVIFRAAAKADADIKLITTADTEVSLLVSFCNEADFVENLIR